MIDDRKVVVDLLRLVFSDACRAAVVANHAEHIRFIFFVVLKRSHFLRHQGGNGITLPRQNAGQCTSERTRLIGIVGDTGAHKDGRQVRKPQSRRAKAPCFASDRLRWELTAEDRRLQHDLRNRDKMPVPLDIKGIRFAIVEAQHVDRSQITARVIEERVFAAWVSRIDSVVLRADFAVFTRRARMPSIKRVVKLRRGVGTPPCRLIENLPQMTDINITINARITAPLKADFRVRIAFEISYLTHEFIIEPDRVVRILPRDSLVGFPVDIRIVTHLCESDDLVFLTRFPRNKALNLRMIDVKTNHLRRTTRRTARLDGASISVKPFQETHETRRVTASGERFAFSANRGEVRPGSGTALEQFCLGYVSFRNGVRPEQLIADGENKASGRLCARVVVFRHDDLAFLLIVVIEFIHPPGDAVLELESRIEPLRRVRRKHLRQYGIDELIVKDDGLFFIDHSFVDKRFDPERNHAVRNLTHGRLVTLFTRNACLSEILRRNDVAGSLRVMGREFKILHISEHATRLMIH